MPFASIKGIEYYLPSKVLENAQLALDFPDWSPETLEAKTGIRTRHLAGDGECSSDLGVRAAEKLFSSGACRREDIDFLLVCTQSPDYFLPTTACLMQDRLGIPKSAGALDFNLGCSGFLYGLSLAKGLVETRQARAVLLITAETYSKFLSPNDRSVRTLFDDGAAATLVAEDNDREEVSIGPFVFGTDGSRADRLIVPVGGMPRRVPVGDVMAPADPAQEPNRDVYLSMDGPEIFNFTLEIVPECVHQLLALGQVHLSDVDMFVFHQANRYILEHLRKRLRIPSERVFVHLANCGNTVSSTIPIALKEAAHSGVLKRGHLIILVGFGVGLSWNGALVRWRA